MNIQPLAAILMFVAYPHSHPCNRNIGVFTVHDGKITSIREYTDTQHAAYVLFGRK